MAVPRESEEVTVVPPIFVITEPAVRPADAAGEPLWTPTTRAPDPVASCTDTPR
jgi:hypothetical protein